MYAHTYRAPVFKGRRKKSKVATDVCKPRVKNAYFIKHPSWWMHEKALSNQ